MRFVFLYGRGCFFPSSGSAYLLIIFLSVTSPCDTNTQREGEYCQSHKSSYNKLKSIKLHFRFTYKKRSSGSKTQRENYTCVTPYLGKKLLTYNFPFVS
jgi:hypothetical protein